MIVENVASYVHEKELNQSAIARHIGVSPQVMNEILKGNRKLGADEYKMICDYLNVPYEKFV